MGTLGPVANQETICVRKKTCQQLWTPVAVATLSTDLTGNYPKLTAFGVAFSAHENFFSQFKPRGFD